VSPPSPSTPELKGSLPADGSSLVVIGFPHILEPASRQHIGLPSQAEGTSPWPYVTERRDI